MTAQPRLFLGGDDFKAKTRLALDLTDEITGVPGAAAGLGRDRAGEMDRAAAHLIGADRQGPDRAFNRGVIQPAIAGQSLAQPDDTGKTVDDDKAIRRGPRDQQTTIIGAKINGGISAFASKVRAIAFGPGARHRPIRRWSTATGQSRLAPTGVCPRLGHQFVHSMHIRSSAGLTSAPTAGTWEST